MSRVAYFNHAGQAELTELVQKAGMEALTRNPWEMNAGDDPQRIRELFSRLIEAESNDIAVVHSTAFAISLAARNVQRTLQNRQGKILVLQDQFPSAVYPWQQICDESTNESLQLEVVSLGGSTSGWTDTIVEVVSSNPILVVCLPPLHWADGELIDLERIGSLCREKGITLIVDATQAVGILPISIKKIQPAVLACSSHKWLRGPAGISLVYIDPALHDTWVPLDLHSRGRIVSSTPTWHATSNEIGPKGYPNDFYPDARKYDAGGKPNPILLPMLRCAMESVVELDLEKMQSEFQTLVEPLLVWAKSHSFLVPTQPHAWHLVGVRPQNVTTEKLLQACKDLKSNGIIVAPRCGGFRVSVYSTNTKDDIDRLIMGLEKIDKSMRA